MKLQTARWLTLADKDRQAARLLATGGFYSQSAFFTHLWVEKVLKALLLERFDLTVPPRTHNLSTMLKDAVDGAPSWAADFLGTLSPESTQARYTLPPDNAVYTYDLATKLFKGAEEVTQWLRQDLT